MSTITEGGILVDALGDVPDQEKYSYIFDGASQLIDWILVSQSAADDVVEAGIAHFNADYPIQLGRSADENLLGYRSSDHDIPYVIIDHDAPAATVDVVTPSHVPANVPVTVEAEKTSVNTAIEDPIPVSTAIVVRPAATSPTIQETVELPVGDQVSEMTRAADENSDGDRPLQFITVPIVAVILFLVTGITLLVAVLKGRKN
jgi:hypothetical protein